MVNGFCSLFVLFIRDVERVYVLELQSISHKRLDAGNYNNICLCLVH